MEVTALAKIKESPAEIFYTSSKGVSLFTIWFLRAGSCGSWHKITSSFLPVGGRVLPTFFFLETNISVIRPFSSLFSLWFPNPLQKDLRMLC